MSGGNSESRVLHTIDDYMMMKEVIERRYRRMLEEKTKLPDLVLVDGGKGQVSIAKQVFNELAIENIPIVGLQKVKTKFIYLFLLKQSD